MYDIVFIVLNWRTPDLAADCIRSIMDTPLESVRTHVLLVDNASGDGSTDVLHSDFGDGIEILEAQENRGYAGGMNLGLRRAGELDARYALLLNADVKLIGEAAGEMFRTAESHPDGAFFGPRIFDVGRPVERWFVGARWDWGQGTIRIVRESESDGLSMDPRKLEFVNGAAMFVRMKAIADLGGFDEQFGLYFEESDLCSRAKRRGYSLWHVPKASVWHVCGASTSKAEGNLDLGQYYRTRNRLLWGQRNLSGLHAAVFWLHILLRWPWKLLFKTLGGRVGEAKAILFGIYDFAAGRFGMR